MYIYPRGKPSQIALCQRPHRRPPASLQLAPEFLSGNSTSLILQPADGFHGKPTHWQAIECPRQRLFFSVLKEAQPPSGLTKRLVAYATAGNKTESGTGSAAASAPEHTTPSAKSKSKSRIAAAQAAKAKSALPVLKTNSKSPPRRSDDGLRGPQAGVAIVRGVQELVPKHGSRRQDRRRRWCDDVND